MHARELVAAFTDRTLPKPAWTHAAHLTVGLAYALDEPDDDVLLDRLRTRIRAYNEATGVANTPTNGYHHTITAYFVVVIREFLRGADVAGRTLDELAAALLESPLAPHLRILDFYSRDLLFSERARAEVVPPDRAPLPGRLPGTLVPSRADQ